MNGPELSSNEEWALARLTELQIDQAWEERQIHEVELSELETETE